MKSAVDIKESLCVSKSGRKCDNEDLLVMTPAFIAVVDGTTDKTGGRFDGKTGGQLAADIIRQVLEKDDSLADKDGAFVVSHIQSALQSYAEEHNTEEHDIHLSASAAIYSVVLQQVWLVGDCQFMIDGKLYTNHKKVDVVLSEARSLAIHMLLKSGVTEQKLIHDDISRQFIMPWLKTQHVLENSDDRYGYQVFSSKGLITDIVSVDVPVGSHVVLATDGYPELMPTLAESESILEKIRREDPLCYRLYKSTKGVREGNVNFDDRTYISFITK